MLERGWSSSGESLSPRLLCGPRKYDINFFQETHLYPSQELTLPIPEGYEIFAISREPSSTFDRQWGGVAAIVRSDLKATVDEPLSGPDLLVLKLGAACLFNAYILPHGSPWEQWSPIHPLQKLSQSIATVRLRGDGVCTIGDLNGRTGDRRASRILHPPRFSLDKTVNTQRRAILQMAFDHDLRLLNGDLNYGNGSWGWTFRHKRKKPPVPANKPPRQSVIDYALCDPLTCAMVQDFEVFPINQCSDHAPLVLKMKIPETPVAVNLGNTYLRDKIREPKSSEAFLDVLLRETLESKLSPEDKRAAFYGPVYESNSRGIKVYTDGSCFENGSPNARAGAGVYVGPNNKFNTSLRITGDQTNNRGELLAILYCLSNIPA
jgi:exonuclease III